MHVVPESIFAVRHLISRQVVSIHNPTLNTLLLTPLPSTASGATDVTEAGE